jgi:lysophospholipase L1-like esterase
MRETRRTVVRLAVAAALAATGVFVLTHSGGDDGAAAAKAYGQASQSQSANAANAASAAPSTTAPQHTPTPSPFSTSRPEPLTVVALGDSVPSATTCDCDGYVEQFGTWLEHTTHRQTVVHNDAVDGWTTADVESSLRSKATRADLSRADLVIIEIGANDFDFGDVDDPACFRDASAHCWAAVNDAMRARLLRIVPAIEAVDANPAVRVTLAGYWNVTRDGMVGRALGANFVTGSDVLTRLVNATIADAARQTGSIYVDFYAPLKGDDGSRDPTNDLLEDGDHPNRAGHTLLTRALITTLQGAGAVASWTQG